MFLRRKSVTMPDPQNFNVTAPENRLPARPEDDLIASLKTHSNRLYGVIGGLLVALLFTAVGWKDAERRFANNVQMTWVKMAPNGDVFVDTQSGKEEPELFQTTVEAYLSNSAEWRLSKTKEIDVNYGRFMVLLSDDQRKRFVNEYKAAEVATTHLGCGSCSNVEAHFRSMHHLDKIDLSSNPKRKNLLYTTLIFVDAHRRVRASGELESPDPDKYIMQVKWRLKSKEEIMSDKKNIRDNPVGVEILDYQIKFDPSQKPSKIRMES